MYSLSEENYLKAIYFLSKNSGKGVSTNAIAERLSTKASSATDMLRKLSEKGLVSYVKYQGASLTESGERVAVKVIRKHRLWEVFLVDHLDFKWDEVHEIAEQLEHIQSVELTNRLDRFLKHPQFDPHGDPIPNQDGIFPDYKREELHGMEPEQGGVLVGVRDTSTEFLNYLEAQKLVLGTQILVLEIFPYDNSMKVLVNGERELTLSRAVTKQLLINQ